jgi:hypothetical protein
MALSEHDHDMTRRYLLGQLTDDEEQLFEERLLSEDEFFQEVELTKDELAQEYVSGELNATERKWLQQNFLASPDGKQRHEFAKTFDHYVKNHRVQQKSMSLIEWLRKLWNEHPQMLTAATTAAVLLIAVGILWPIIRPPAPRTVATLIVMNSSGTRSSGPGSRQRIKLTEDALNLTLTLPQAVSPGSTYSVELLSDKNRTQTFEGSAQNAQSVSVEISASTLPRGQYAATVSNNGQRIPGNYEFIIE